jgi:hypothetical protein
MIESLIIDYQLLYIFLVSCIPIAASVHYKRIKLVVKHNKLKRNQLLNIYTTSSNTITTI